MLGEESNAHSHGGSDGDTSGSGKGKGDKTGKGDGSSGSTTTAMSALKSSSKRTPPVQKNASLDAVKGNGPERRRKNMYVAVERRRQGPPKPG